MVVMLLWVMATFEKGKKILHYQGWHITKNTLYQLTLENKCKEDKHKRLDFTFILCEYL